MTLRLNGSTSGYSEIDAPATAGNNTIVLPSSNGAAGQLLRNSSTAGTLQFDSNVSIDSSGRMLIGMSSSTINSYLQVQGGPATSAGNFALWSTLATPGTGTTLGTLNFGADPNSSNTQSARIAALRDGGTWTAGASQPTMLAFSTTADGASSPTERMRIAPNGTVTFNSDGGTPDASTSGFRFIASGVQIAYSSASGGGSRVFEFGGNAGYARIMGDGDLENTNNRYTGISDVKLKQNIEDASSQWDDLKVIQVRKYELIAHPERKHIGVIAQELEQVCPGLVIERIQNEETGETVKSVAYSVLYMKAVKALQEAMERIEILETKVAALEGTT